MQRRKAWGHGAGEMTILTDPKWNGRVLGVFNEELIFHGEKQIIIHNQWEIHDYKSWFHMFSWDFIGFMVMNGDSTNQHGDIV